MFSKTFLSSAVALCLALQVSAHAAVNPALGVKGNTVRGDVQRPSAAKPCGNVDIASKLDSSTAVSLNADGSFSATAVDFNAGGDGSRSVSAQVDASGTGKSFVAAQVTKNGNAKPSSTGSDAITVQLPKGIKCTGGKNKDLCLVSFKTTAGFGNCVVVKGAAAGGKNNAANNVAAGAGAVKAQPAAPAKAPAAPAKPAAAAPAKPEDNKGKDAAKKDDKKDAAEKDDKKKGDNKGKGKGMKKGKGKGKGMKKGKGDKKGKGMKKGGKKENKKGGMKKEAKAGAAKAAMGKKAARADAPLRAERNRMAELD